MLEEGLGRFARVTAGRVYAEGPLIYDGPAMPLGPEDEVRDAFLNRLSSLDGIKGVVPALDAAFRMESWHRADVEFNRAEAERQRREEEARLAAEERRAEFARAVGDGAGRRAMASVDFEAAARAALAVGGAELLDQRRSAVRGEMVVVFKLGDRRFECTCVGATLRIVDSGICLRDHNTGEAGDTYFTLESLPGVIRQAERERRLHVYRHVDPEDDDDREDWDD
jgi:hypothetical protein